MTSLRTALLTGAVAAATALSLSVSMPVAGAEPADPTQTYETIVQSRTRARKDDQLKLTGRELAERGARDLAEALDLLPDVRVRAAGRGGFQVDLRGARKGMVLVVVDGVPVDDPYYGNFDLSSIPVTDIVNIRVSLAPASPLDGPGGSGGVVEVVTRAATGTQRVHARSDVSSAGGVIGAVTARRPVGGALAVRVSASGGVTERDLVLLDPSGARTGVSTTGDQAQATLRIEHLTSRARVVSDLSASRRTMLNPPGTDQSASLTRVAPEYAARASVAADLAAGQWRTGGRLYGNVLSRLSESFSDSGLEQMVGRENLLAGRAGAGWHADRSLGRTRLALRASLDADFASVRSGVDAGTEASGKGGVGQLAFGVGRPGRVRVQADGGLALPVSGGTPWPEAKLTLGWDPDRVVGLRVTSGYKGRAPSLRERFAPQLGNTELSPERVAFAETEVIVAPARWLKLRANAFARRVTDMIQFRPSEQKLINTGTIAVRGTDCGLEVGGDVLAGALSYGFTDTDSGANLDYLPRHRADASVTVRRKRVGGTVRVRFSGEQFDRGTALPSYTTVEASAWARLPGRMTATARATNLGDVGYRERTSVIGPGRTVSVGLEGVFD